MSRDILLGVVIGAQGLRGEVKVKTFTESPERLGAYGALHAKDGRAFVVKTARAAKAGLVKARVHNNPEKAQPKKKAQERAAAAAKAAEEAPAS